MLPRLILLVLIIAGVVLVRKARPVLAKHGVGLNPPVDEVLDSGSVEGKRLEQGNDVSSDTSFTVATFNVQTGKSLHGKRDISKAAKAISNADIVGVQEVYAPGLANLMGVGLSQTAALSKQGRFNWLFCATRRRWLREHRGNALLSKLDIGMWHTEPLPDQSGKSYRNMTVAQAHWQGEEFYIINTHLHTRKGRSEQLDVVLREFAKYPRAILVGDFNTRADDAGLENAFKNVEISDAVTIAKLDLDNKDRIDWIFTKGFNVETGRMIEKGISDHPYYEVTLSIKHD